MTRAIIGRLRHPRLGYGQRGHGRLHRRRGAALAVALLSAACGGGGDGEQAAQSECDLDALDQAVEDEGGPVEISFWIGMGSEYGEVLQGLIDEFEASQDRVRVNLLSNNGDRENQEKYLDGVQSGRLPDIVQHENVFLQKLIDSSTVLPLDACIEAEDYDQSDYMERLVNYYVVEDTQWGFPFNINTPVLVYDRNAFVEAGLDPDEPPTTFDELYGYAEAIKNSGPPERRAGMGLKEDGWLMEVFRALQGEPLVDNANGRDGRPTEVVFDDELGVEIFTGLNDLVQDGLAVTNPTEGSDRLNNLFAIGAQQWGMTFDSSGAIGLAMQTLETDDLPVDPGVAPLPGLAEGGGVPVGGGGLFISADDPAKQVAAWELAKFLTSPHAQAVWSAATGFIPVRESSVEEQELIDAWEETPEMRVAYDQAASGDVNDASAGAVIGEYRDLRRTMEETVAAMFRGELTPEEAVSRAAEQINESITTYNEGVEI